MQTIDGDASIPAILAEAREFTRRGKYSSAAKLLERALTCYNGNVELVLALAETYTDQGYINRAYALVNRDELPENTISGDVLRILGCFIAPLTSGQFTESIEEAERINSRYDANEPSDTAFLLVAMVRLFHFKALALYSVFHHSDGVTRMEASQECVVMLIDKMLEVRDLSNAYKFTNVLLDNGKKQAKLEALLKLDNVPLLLRAKVQAVLAETLEDSNDQERRDHLRACAHPVLEEEHHHAALDIDIGQAIEQFEKSPEQVTRTDIDDLLLKYRSLDYPNGLKKWLYRLQTVVTKLHSLEAQNSLYEELKVLSIKTGTLVVLLVERVNNIARFHQNTGHDDLVKTTLLRVYCELVDFQVPYTLGQVASILTDHFVRLRDVNQALKWARQCVLHWKVCSPTSQSIANHQLLRAEIIRFQESDSEDCQPIQTICEELVAADLAQGLKQEAIMKIGLMHGVFYSCGNVPFSERISVVHKYLVRSQDILHSISGSDIRHQQAALLQEQATFFMFCGSQRSDTEMEENAIELFEQALALTYATSNQTLTFQLITVREQIGTIYLKCSRKLLLSDRARSKGFLDLAEECFSVSLTGRDAMGTTVQVAEGRYWIAFLRYEKRTQGWVTSEEVLQSLLEAEAAFDALRLEISISSGINAIKDKQALATQKHVRDIYRFAFQVCVLDRDAVNAWNWTQKAKARSLSDTLGLGCLIPESLLSRIESDVQTKQLYEQEQRLSRQLEVLTPTESFSAAMELRKLRVQMSATTTLREMLELRQGKAVTTQELVARWKKLPIGRYATDVAFVDWYVKGEDEIYMLVLQPMASPILRRVNATVQGVRAWIEEHLHSEEGQDRSIGRSDDHPNQSLRALDALVEFIGDYVNQDVLLVLSPAAPLDALPLHALHVRSSEMQHRGKPLPLIERNPVIYCSNMTVFVQCCELAASKLPSSGLKNSLMAVYEEIPSESFNEDERKAVYDFMGALATEYGTPAVVGRDVSRGRIFSEWPSADHILFLGHCDLSSEDITEQSLILAPSTANADGSSSPHLIVKEIFDLKLNGPVVELMACGSSAQKMSAGDEPLGLVTALLCAGAGSVIGTLWPVASGTARRFTKIFRQQLKGLQNESSTDSNEGLRTSTVAGVIDLAVAVQRTVRELRKSGPRPTRTPAHWATFVIHGSAFLKVPVSVKKGADNT